MEKILYDIRDENKWIREAFNNQDLVSIDTMLNKIEDLLDEINFLNETIDELNDSLEEQRRVDADLEYDRWKENHDWK